MEVYKDIEKRTIKAGRDVRRHEEEVADFCDSFKQKRDDITDFHTVLEESWIMKIPRWRSIKISRNAHSRRAGRLEDTRRRWRMSGRQGCINI